MVNKLMDKAILDELRTITKNKVNWVTAIDDVAAKLGEQYSADVKAKASRISFIVFAWLSSIQRM